MGVEISLSLLRGEGNPYPRVVVGEVVLFLVAVARLLWAVVAAVVAGAKKCARLTEAAHLIRRLWIGF